MIGDMRAPSTDARSRWRMSLLTPRGPRSAARSASRAAYTGSGWVIVVLLLDFSGSWDFSGGTAAAARLARAASPAVLRSEEHTSELQSLMRTSYAVFCLKKKT